MPNPHRAGIPTQCCTSIPPLGALSVVGRRRCAGTCRGLAARILGPIGGHFILAGPAGAAYLWHWKHAVRPSREDPMTRTTTSTPNTPRKLTARPASRSRALGVPPPVQNGMSDRPAEDDIRILAYQKWEAAGCPEGDGERFWLAAEQELRARV